MLSSSSSRRTVIGIATGVSSIVLFAQLLLAEPLFAQDGGMADRFKKYDIGDGEPGGFRRGQGFRQMSPEQRQELRERFRQMSPEQRQQIRQRFKQSGGGQGFPGRGQGGDPGPGGDFMTAQPDAMPPAMRRNGQMGSGQMRRGQMGGGPGGRMRNNQMRNNQMQGGRQWFNRKPLDLTVLGLSDKQKSRIQEMRGRNALEARKINSDLKSMRTRMRDLMFDPNATREDIFAAHKELVGLQGEAEAVMLNDFLGIRSVLTPEQLQRLPELKPGGRQRAQKPSPGGDAGL